MRRPLFPFFIVLFGALAVGRAPAVPAIGPREGMMPEVSGVTVPGLPPVTPRFHVDQFGYLPDEKKTAVISDPRTGYNAGTPFTPSAELEVRRVGDGTTVHRGAPAWFANGKVDALSGDRGWWFDFSAVKEPGDYYVFDAKQNLRSHVFRVAPDVFAGVLRAAVRTFFYQREACDRAAPFAEAPWFDGPSFLQDRTTRAVWAKDDPTLKRDLHGGWMDAGDTNKYPPFLRDVIHPLLYAWRENPAAFGDDFGIPESGNGLPDLLDEVKWELDWLARMQDADGALPVKMGTIDYANASPPSTDRRQRYYGRNSSGSAIVAAGIFAHAARVYGQFVAWKPFAAELRERAERSWRWYRSHPRTYELDSGEIKSGDADMDAATQDRSEAFAALHLWALTGEASYHEAFRRHFATTRQLRDPSWSPYESGQAEALFEYLCLPGADPTVAGKIRQAYARSLEKPDFLPAESQNALYRARMVPSSFHWGSSFVRAGLGMVAHAGVQYDLGGPHNAPLRQRALDLLHSFHGVNPPGVVYLTNMSALGAETSVTRLWHDWFNQNSPFAAHPPPGYVVGGPNAGFTGTIAWVKQQPPEKAYADSNAGWPAESWALSEPAIYYQAMYIRLLASFVRR